MWEDGESNGWGKKSPSDMILEFEFDIDLIVGEDCIQ